MKKAKRMWAVALAAVSAVAALFGMTGCKKTELTGFDIELARAVGAKLSLEVVFEEIDWEQKDNELNAKNIDLIWNGFTITDKRRETITFSNPYLSNKQSVVIRKSDAATYTDLASLAGARLTAEASSAGASIIENDPILSTAVYNDVAGLVNVLTEVKSGTSDAGVVDSIMLDYYLNNDSAYADSLMVIEGLVLAEEEYGIGMRYGSAATCDKINTALAELQASGELEQIATQFGLQNNLLDCSYTSTFDSIADKSDWEYLAGRGKIIIGYTIFAPIAFAK